MIVGQDTPDKGTLGSARPSTRLRRPERDVLDGTKTVGRDQRRLDLMNVAGRTMQSRAYVASFTSRQRPSERSRSSRAASATVAPGEGAHERRQPVLLDERPNESMSTRCDRSRTAVDFAARGDHQPRPLVLASHRDAHAGLRGRGCAWGGSRGTTPTTRLTASGASAPRRIARTAALQEAARG